MVLLLMMGIFVMRVIMGMRINMKIIKMKKMVEMLKWLLQAAPSLLLCGLSCSSGAL